MHTPSHKPKPKPKPKDPDHPYPPMGNMMILPIPEQLPKKAKGGAVKMAKGGFVRAADGAAQRGKTKGRTL